MRRGTRTTGALAVAAGLALLGLLVPDLRTPLGLVCVSSGLVLVLAGMRLHRPRHRLPWALVALSLGMLLGVDVITAATGRETAVAGDLVLAVEALSGGLVIAVLFTQLRGDSHLGRADAFLAAAGAALLAVQVVLVLEQAAPDAPMPWVALAVPAFDIWALAMIVHLALVRRGMERSTTLALAGSASYLLCDLLAMVSGQRVALPGQPMQVLTAAGALLLGLAALQPDMGLFAVRAPGRRLRSASARLLAAAPAYVTAPLLWALGLAGVLPSIGESLVVPAGYLLGGAGLTTALLSLRHAEHLAERDPLTELLNRRGLDGAVDELRRRLAGEPLQLCVVDLDDFKHVNDVGGHRAGDELLVEVGARLTAAVGPRGVVARTGGDEFLVVVADAADGWGAGDLVLAALDPPFDCLGVPTAISASVGVVGLPHGACPDDLLLDADVAMYAAKQAGKGRALTYRPELRERVLGDFELRRELRLLLEGGDPEQVGRLVVLYQPIVALEGTRVVGAEALVRWKHPRWGVVSPDAFLPAVEAAGLGARLDEQVAAQAVEQLAAWDAAGLPRVDVHLNLGIGSMRRPNLHRAVGALVERHGLSPDRVHLEITEHDELPADAASTSVFEALAAAGFPISLDDFGVGYTSLTYLRRFPISVVKLDKSLTELVEGSAEVPLLQGISALCRALGVTLLAEGVASGAQVPPLRELGVTYAQGFHFARPLAAEAFAALVAQAAGGCAVSALDAARQAAGAGAGAAAGAVAGAVAGRL
ncbi:bifunctional diguanylate cyclase/phosphodiesterase [Kineococcus glutinatus]|uniref:Diguanylate cyclase (GGDEF)-like protein n=1 Tax=Kineococcus glutinatus TaxID=1070872 RepID=A0ABP9HXI2_9ACTN